MTKLHLAFLICLLSLPRASSALGQGATFPTLDGNPLIPIKWTAGCGIDALYMCLDLNKVPVTYAEMVAKSGLTSPGDPIDMATLWHLARRCGAYAQGIRVTGGPDALRNVMRQASARTAIVHLKAVEREAKRQAEHFCAVHLCGDTLRIVGQDSYESEVAKEWKARWSGAALLVSAKPITLAGAKNAPLPQVVLSPSKFDCGTVYAGTKTAYEFCVENRGDGDLEITGAKSDCSCSTPSIGQNVLAPNQSTTLTGYVEAGPTVGRRTVRITVFSTDPARPDASLEVTLDVAPLPVKLSEPKVVMTTKSRAERLATTLGIEYTDPGAAIHVVRLEASAEWLKAELSADGRQVTLSADPLDSTKSRSTTLILHTAEPEAMLKVPVEAHLIGPVECRPAQIYLDRKSEHADVIRRTIELRPQPDVPFDDVKAEVRGVPGAVKSIRRVAEKGVWEVEVEFDLSGERTAMTVGMVEISGAAEGDGNKVQVPVYVR
jgi:hypothetical protein